MADKAQDKIERSFRNPTFFAMAASVFAAVMLPAGARVREDDERQAETTGEACALLLDSGVVPEGFVLPEHALVLAEIASDEELTKNPGRISAMERQQRLTQQLERARKQGTPPSREQVVAKNAAALKVLGDISEPVRAAAFFAAAARLGVKPPQHVGGLSLNDALAIVAAEIFRAQRFADRAGVAGESLSSTLEKIAKGSVEDVRGLNVDAVLPWPANLGFNFLRGCVALDEEEPGSVPGGDAAGAKSP